MKKIQEWLKDNGFQISNTAKKVTELLKDGEYVYVDNEITSDIGDIFIHPKHQNKRSSFEKIEGVIKRKDKNRHAGLSKFPKKDDRSQESIKFGFSSKKAFDEFLNIFLDKSNVATESNSKSIEKVNSDSLIDSKMYGSENLDNTSVDEKTLQAIKTRRGQAKFRQDLLLEYDKKCCITNSRVESVLEAAHIIPHTEDSNYSV